jgi:hypothetical protein
MTVRGHRGESGVDVPRVKRSVRGAEQFDFRRRLIWHEEPQGGCASQPNEFVSPE